MSQLGFMLHRQDQVAAARRDFVRLWATTTQIRLMKEGTPTHEAMRLQAIEWKRYLGERVPEVKKHKKQAK